MAKYIFCVSLYFVHIFGCVFMADCPNTWVENRGACYYFVQNIVLDFFEAQHYCNQHHGASLVRAETPEENLFLKDFIRGLKGSDRWLGLTDETTEGIWEWYGSDTATEYTDWGPTEPSNSNGVNEDCVIFYALEDYKWADASCTSKYAPVCEKTVNDGGEIVG